MWSQIRWFKGASTTGDQYVEVSTSNPLPVTTVGGGAGGAEEVQITSTGGDAATGTYGSQATSVIGLTTNARIMGENGANAIPIAASNMSSDNADKNAIGIFTNSRLMGYDPAGDNYDRVRIDVDGNLKVTDVGSQSITANVLNVTTAGTRVQLPTVVCKEVTIIAKKANTGQIYLGGSTVSSTVYGLLMDAKDSITLKVANANMLWIDASANGEGISYIIL
jgi:hypothetical protein